MILSDGTTLRNLTVNGNCLISDFGIKSEILTDKNLKTVTVNEQEYHNVTLVRKWEHDGKVWLALRQKTEEELWREQLQSNIDYLAMMTDVEMGE